MPTSQFIEFERKRLQITKESQCLFQGRDNANIMLRKQGEDAWKSSGFPNETAPYPSKFLQMKLDISTVNSISISLMKITEPIVITVEHIVAAKVLVKNLLKENVDNIVVNISQTNEREDVEGFYLSYGVDGGEVFVPKRFPTPTELITHELGHAVHHRLRRESHPTKPTFWMGSSLEAELCAYYTQINYILRHGTKANFYQALGALSHRAAELAVLRAATSNQSLEDFINSNEFAPYSGVSTRNFVLDMFRKINPSTDFDGREFNSLRSSFPRGLGFSLALKLVDERDGMRIFMQEDSSSVPLADKLAKAFPHRNDLNNLDDLPEVIASLAARFDS